MCADTIVYLNETKTETTIKEAWVVQQRGMIICDVFAIWYHLYNFKNVKNTNQGVLLLGNFTKSSTDPWVFSAIFKLYKWYQIAQNIPFILKTSKC